MRIYKGMTRYMQVLSTRLHLRAVRSLTIREMQCHSHALCKAYRVISLCQYYGYHLAARVLSLLITNALRRFCINIGASSLLFALYLPHFNIRM